MIARSSAHTNPVIRQLRNHVNQLVRVTPRNGEPFIAWHFWTANGGALLRRPGETKSEHVPYREIAAVEPFRANEYAGPMPETVAQAREVLDGLGAIYRRLPETVASRIFILYEEAGLA